MTRKSKTRGPLKDSKGMTMVEIVVAFAVLLLVLALANTGVQTSMRLSNMAEDVRQRTETALTGYYATEREAEEAVGSFGDFTLPLYAGVYTDPTGYSFYWFHDGQEHTPPVPPSGEYPAWLPENDPKMENQSDNYDTWQEWWNAVVANSSECASDWMKLLQGENKMQGNLQNYAIGNGKYKETGGHLCPP